ncbi:MAG: hypothetical protein AB1758_03820 [Candidatus Eremiobacterota bacterium]
METNHATLKLVGNQTVNLSPWLGSMPRCRANRNEFHQVRSGVRVETLLPTG